MNAADWGPLAARIEGWWSQPVFDELRSAAYFERLQDYEFEQVEEVWGELLTEGHQYVPSLSLVIGKLEDRADSELRFESMWGAVKASLSEEHPERFLETEHPLYLRFYMEQGRFDVLTRVDEGNSYTMHQLRMAWKELTAEFRTEQRRGRVRKALTARPLISLEVERERRRGPRKLDATKGLPPGGGK